jgi:hypothetical protein
MDDKELFVEDNGQISDPHAEVKPGQKVVWKPRTTGNKIDIFFDDKVPFNALKEPKWLNKQETNEDKIDGKVKGHKKGTITHYPYNTIRALSDPSSGPELIVDGGPEIKHKKKKAKTAKAAKKARKTKKAKSLSRAKTVKKKKVSKARKSRAAKKR